MKNTKTFILLILSFISALQSISAQEETENPKIAVAIGDYWLINESQDLWKKESIQISTSTLRIKTADIDFIDFKHSDKEGSIENLAKIARRNGIAYLLFGKTNTHLTETIEPGQGNPFLQIKDDDPILNRNKYIHTSQISWKLYKTDNTDIPIKYFNYNLTPMQNQGGKSAYDKILSRKWSRIKILETNLSTIIKDLKIATPPIKIKAEPILAKNEIEKTVTPVMPVQSKGNLHALCIGINDYKYINKLKTAINDASASASILKKDFGYNVTTLSNSTRLDIIKNLNHFRRTLKKGDKFLIYYAGHGYYDKETDVAYWLPANAEQDDQTFWISASDITTSIKGSKATSVLIVSDSCYSGTLKGKRGFKVTKAKTPTAVEMKTFEINKSRLLLASGGNEPVSDNGKNNHSIFANAFLNALQSHPSEKFTVNEIYPKIFESVLGSGQQKPVLDFIINSGHESGSYIFNRISQ